VPGDERINRRVVAGEHVDIVIAEQLAQEDAVERVHPGLIGGLRLLECFRPHRLDAKLTRQRKLVLG
jgi:hypothetical protein